MHYMQQGATLLLLLLLRGATPELQSNAESVEQFGEDGLSLVERISFAQGDEAKEAYELTTNLGTIIGLVESTSPPHYSNTHYHAFRSIPYAKPPVKELRFSDPVDLEGPWPGKHLNATEASTMCPLNDPQSGKVYGKEDCLLLNIYTPSHLGHRNRAENVLLPVFVFFHGGAFMRGSSSSYGAGKLLSRDIVVVTVNYRIGALGFLSTGDSIIPGNYGMLDQVSALRWIQRNIAQFGGDPKQVTIGGLSAGGASVGLHVLSPLSKNLFHRGFMSGGAGFCDWSVNSDPMTDTRLIAKKLGCNAQTSWGLRDCLLKKTSEEIAGAQGSIFEHQVSGWFVPVIDKGLRATPFLPAPLKELSPNNAPMIIGVAAMEGLLFAAHATVLAPQPSNVTNVYESLARSILTPWPYPDVEQTMLDLGEAFHYSKEARTDGATFLEQFAEAVGDRHLGHCIWDTASYIADSGIPVYTYVMTHRDPESPVLVPDIYNEVKALGYDTPLLDTAPSHGDDTIYIFKFPFSPSTLSDRDNRVGQILLHMTANFVISGNPQEDLETYGIQDIPKWDPLQPGEPVGYYDIAVHPKMVSRPYREKEQNFWKNIVPRPESKLYSRTKKFLREMTWRCSGNSSECSSHCSNQPTESCSSR